MFDFRSSLPSERFVAVPRVQPLARMIHVWWPSGAMVAAVPLAAEPDECSARSLKRQIARQCGVPRFRQKLFLLPTEGSQTLDDDDVVHSEIKDLQLVVLPFAPCMQGWDFSLQMACEINDIRGVERLLQRPEDPNASGAACRPLVTASERGFAEILELLLEARADTEMRGASNYVCAYSTPLKAAVAAQQMHIVRRLLQAHANPDSCIHVASERNDTNFMRLLLEARSANGSGSPNDVDDVDYTEALFRASKLGNAKIVNLLLHARVDAGSSFGLN